MEHKALRHTNPRRNDIRISEHERALAEAHAYQVEMVLRLARKVAALARAAAAAVARVYVRGLVAKGDLIHKYMGNMP